MIRINLLPHREEKRKQRQQAFVGMLVGVHHFNQDFRLGDPKNPDTSNLMVNWGGAFGVVRGKHLWELDLMGSSLSLRLGFAPAFVLGSDSRQRRIGRRSDHRRKVGDGVP